ncbi:zinc finger protein GIS3-like [Iris pallida]|uniref:Zinc finger protein GIS3-like n=1 Tax=Iris pallida TaxID=29817 RepID=A0AAX6EBF1_IRIPA|nr:zinc finger protein GIS3-like [Iris pallida]
MDGVEPDSVSSNNGVLGVEGGEVKKLIRLFGFELGIDVNSTEAGREKSSDSSSSHKTASGGAEEEKKKYGCRFCFKEFANSQALGGHQNAHKKERLKRRRLEVQARRTVSSFSCCYLQPLIRSRGAPATTEDGPFVSYSCGPSFRAPGFMLLEEAHGSFEAFDPSLYAAGYSASEHGVVSSHAPFQPMQINSANRSVVMKPMPLSPVGKHSQSALDLQLGLRSSGN